MARARIDAALPYQAVFVDWQMPGLDGWETSRMLRENGWVAPGSVVVMVTAHGREMLAQRDDADQDLLDAFLVKPVTASMLFDAIADGRHGLARELRHSPVVSAGSARLRGLRLLLTEDNLNNQQVARELLEDEGAIVQIANHGQEAVEAVAAADPPFDVVLMDLQMPVMDGFTATARIRQDLKQARLPIIAMTANAMASDREACLAAGMNDHVGKPFDLDHLVQVLLLNSGRGGRSAPAMTDDTHAGGRAAAGPQHAHPNAAQATLPGQEQAAVAGVNLGTALRRLGGKLPAYTRMLRGFVGDLQTLPDALRAAASDTTALARQLHTLKGVAATLGADTLAAQAGAAESRCADADADLRQELAADIATSLEGARTDLQRLLAALQAAVQAEPASDMQTADPAALAADLKQLIALLQASDMAALDALAQLRSKHGNVLGDALEPLENAMAALDFEHAAQLCVSLQHDATAQTP
jgi:CheY-like chemotaxis protein